MKKLRLTSFCLAFVMVVALMVPALSVMATAASSASVTNALTNLPSATTPEWTGHAWHNGSSVQGLDYDLIQADPVYAGKTYTLSDNLLSEDVAVKRDGTQVKNPETGKDEYKYPNEQFNGPEPFVVKTVTPTKAGSNVVGLMLKVTLTNGSGNNNAFDFGFKAHGVYYTTANTYTERGNTVSGTKSEIGTYSIVYLSDKAHFNDQWNYYFAYDASHATTRVPGGFDGYVFIPASAMVEMANQAGTANYGREQGVYGDRFTAMDNLIAGGISEIGINAYWGDGTYTLSEMKYVYVESTEVTHLPGESNLAWSFGWYAPVANNFVNAPKGDEIRYVSNTEANSNKSTVGAPFTIGEKWTTTDNLTYTAPVSHVLPGKKIAGVIFDLDSTLTSGPANSNDSLNATLTLGEKSYISNKGNTEQGAFYIVDDNSGAWYTVSNKYFAYVNAYATRENYTRIPQLKGKAYIPLDAFYNSGVGATDASVQAAGTITLKLDPLSGLTGKLPFSNVAFVYVDVEDLNRPTALPAVDTEEWHHAAWNDTNANNNLGQGIAMNVDLAGKKYTLSDNLLSSPVVPSEAAPRVGGDKLDVYTQVELNAPVKAGKNVAGIMINLSCAGASATNNGLTFGFRVDSPDPSDPAKTIETYYSARESGIRGTTQSYLYGSVSVAAKNTGYENDTWMYYSDPTTHSAARLPNSFDGYVYIPLDAIMKTVTTDGILHRVDAKNVMEGTSATSDLINHGIAMLEVGVSFGAVTLAVSEICYVYVEGYDPINSDTLPAGDSINAWSIGFVCTVTETDSKYSAHTSSGTTAVVPNNLNAVMKGLKYTTVKVGKAATTPVTAMKTEAQYIIDSISAPTSGVVGLMVDAAALASGTNNGVTVALEVDGTVYYCYSFDRFAENYIQYDGSSQWLAVSNSYYGFSQCTDGPQRQFRLPSQFDGKIFIPLDSFNTVWSGPITNYNTSENRNTGTEVTLTAETLASATSIKFHGLAIYNSTTSFGDVSFVYAAKSAIAAAAPVLGEDITLKVQSNIAWNTDNVTLDVDLAENDTVTLTGVQGEDNAFYFAFENIKAQNMTDNIAMTLKVDGAEVASIDEYSIKAYAESLIANSADAKAVALAEAMLQYGAAAQKVAGYKPDDLAAELKDFSETTPDGNVSGTVTVKVSAQLDKEIGLTIKGVYGTVVATISDGVNSRTFTVQSPVDGTVILEGIGANELANTITLTVGDTVVKTLSVNAYLAEVAGNASNSPEEITLAKALYEYGLAAAAYAPASY